MTQHPGGHPQTGSSQRTLAVNSGQKPVVSPEIIKNRVSSINVKDSQEGKPFTAVRRPQSSKRNNETVKSARVSSARSLHGNRDSRDGNVTMSSHKKKQTPNDQQIQAVSGSSNRRDPIKTLRAVD